MAPRRSRTKANNPYWSTHVETWCCGHQEAEEYCRRRKLLIATFERWACHLVSPKDLRKRTEHLHKLCREKQYGRVKRGNRSGSKGLRAIATVCVRTAVRSLFERSGACVLKR